MVFILKLLFLLSLYVHSPIKEIHFNFEQPQKSIRGSVLMYSNFRVSKKLKTILLNSIDESTPKCKNMVNFSNAEGK